MPRKRKSNKRRQKFITVGAFLDGEKDLRSVINEAKKIREERKQGVVRSERFEAATRQTVLDAGEATELFLRGLSHSTTALQLARDLLNILYVRRLASVHDLNMLYNMSATSNASATSNTSAIRRCEIRRKAGTAPPIAFVTVGSETVARALLDSSSVVMPDGQLVRVSRSRRLSVPGVGSAWRTASDPASMRWKIGQVQVGERLSPSIFTSFWSSSEFFDLTENSHVEVNPVAKALAVTIGRSHRVFMAVQSPESRGRGQDFESSRSMLRMEFPFRSICDDPRVEDNVTGAHCSVYFSISKPPFLFRTETGGAENSVDPNNWDCLGGTAKVVRWVRTVDPSRGSGIARARGFRIKLLRDDMYSFVKRLHDIGLADSRSPEVVTPGKSRAEITPPDRHALLRTAAEKYGLSFRVRYLLECVISLGSVSVAGFGSDFWNALAKEMTEDEALAALDCMHFYVSSNDAFTRINKPYEVLRECMTMLDIVPRSSLAHEVSRSIEANAESTGDETDDDSIGTEDTEDFVTEKYVRELRLEELNISDNGGSVPSSLKAEEARHIGARRPSRQTTYIRRVVVTPMRTLAQKAECDLLNRVLREFSKYRDRFLRVSFLDEDGDSIGCRGSADLLARVRKTLRDGILVGGEKFVFLAFSNSQLRDHAVWMYNETGDALVAPPSADDIRQWMGNFSDILVPGKFAARQGQAFSSTVGTLSLEPFQEEHIPDIQSDGGEYLFSDGVGLISYDLAKQVSRKLRLNSLERLPSAFQVRYGGAKGMLTVWDVAIPGRHGGQSEIALRPSMKKFQCSHRALEVVGFSKRIPLYLNRQLIVLLSGMGVPDKPFENMQARLLRQLDKAMRSDGATAALDVLYSSGCCDSAPKLRSGAPMMNADAFFRAGLTCVSCEHLFNIMDAFRQRMIKDLIQKARIPVASDKGVCALGIMDELRVLAPNEIFCQFTDPVSGKTLIVSGNVTVGRYPCLHPGDIQPVSAVDHYALRHLVDVIVFPQIGPRPLPSMLSGGDLDGDLYFCLFDARIAYPRSQGANPMSYKAPAPRSLSRAVTTSDVADFFVDYIENDRLGQIASAHVVHADKEADGIHSETCLTLAELHSIAVDFAKTGVPAKFSRDLQPRIAAGQFPDFMQRHPRISYKSKRVLGKLYRACKAKRDSEEPRRQAFPNRGSQRIDDIIDSFPRDERFDREAEKLCGAYNVEIVKMMDQYGVQTEGELVSGQVMSFAAQHGQIRARREQNALTLRLNREARDLRSQFRELFFRGLGQQDQSECTTDAVIKACAWYRACHKLALDDRRDDMTALLSFPWVVSDILLQVIGNELRAE